MYKRRGKYVPRRMVRRSHAEWHPLAVTAPGTDTGQQFVSGLGETNYGRLLNATGDAEDLIVHKPQFYGAGLYEGSGAQYQKASWNPGPYKLGRFQGWIRVWLDINAQAPGDGKGALLYYMWRRLKVSLSNPGGGAFVNVATVVPPPAERSPAQWHSVTNAEYGDWFKLARGKDILAFGQRTLLFGSYWGTIGGYANYGGSTFQARIPLPRLGRMGLVIQDDEALVLTTQVGGLGNLAQPGSDDPLPPQCMVECQARVLTEHVS